MINKKNLWFLTLFSLILVLSVYYVTMPTELLITNNSNFVTKDTSEEDTKVSIEENEVIEEIARRSSGEINEVTMQYATELRNRKAS